jgi:hypothetical protein
VLISNRTLLRVYGTCMIHKKIVATFFSFSLSLSLTGAVLVTGDTNAPAGATFSFGIAQNQFSVLGNYYVGANELLTTSQEFAFSRLAHGLTVFEPLAPATVTITNNKEILPDQPNPLFGQKINALGLLKPVGRSDAPVVVTAAQPAVVYLFENVLNAQTITLIPTGPLHDAAGNISSGVASLTTDIIGHVFAAVSPAGGIFGDTNSGIALMTRGFMNEEGIFGEVDAATGNIVIDPKALLLDPSSDVVKLGTNNLAAMGNIVSLTWNDSLKRFFIGLQTTANSGAADGTRAVVVGQLVAGGGISLMPIAPKSAFQLNNTQTIIGALGANQQVTINLLNTMNTSTALPYLMVVGGNGTPATTGASVFALPLVNAGDMMGTIANKNAIPVDTFQQSGVPILLSRTISQPATDISEMPQATDSAVLVGGGPLTAGNIDDIIVRDDTIFVLVGNGSVSNASGVYSSQALFDVTGKIKVWTAWQRATGTTDNIFGGALDAFDGTFILASGTDSASVNTIKRTVWSNGDPQGLLPATILINTEFNVQNGGIQGLTTFLNTPALTTVPFFAAGGVGSLMLVQTGTINNTIAIPTPADEFNPAMEFTNGTIDHNVHAKVVLISGGALTNVGPITTTEIATIQTTAWLFVGGSGGVAILSHADGTGWDPAAGQLGNNFAGLTAGMSFKTVGNYQFVKKLIYDGNFLYVITNDLVDRIDLNATDFSTDTLSSLTIATKTSLVGVSSYGGILDGIFSAALGILATTAGMVRVGDGADVRIANSESDLNWTPVSIPENAGAPTQLLGVSQTNREQNIAEYDGGQIYILTANAGDNQSRINRFAIETLANGPVRSTTVQPFNDLFVQNIPSFFLNFGLFKSGFATDGALYFATKNQQNTQAPYTVITPAFPAPIVSGRNIGERSTTVAIPLNTGTELNALERSQASGSWLLAGDFGMRVLE